MLLDARAFSWTRPTDVPQAHTVTTDNFRQKCDEPTPLLAMLAHASRRSLRRQLTVYDAVAMLRKGQTVAEVQAPQLSQPACPWLQPGIQVGILN